MNFRSVYTMKLAAATLTSSAADTELDLQKSFVNVGKREMKATLVAYNGVSSDSFTFDYKLQESNTTVDSDFADITGAAFTQVTDASTPAPEDIHFFTAKRYVRGYHTVGSGNVEAVAILQAVKRDA